MSAQVGVHTCARPATRDLFVATTGHGPPLFLLHGFALHGGLFAPIVADLARRHRVHALDLPGHGHSPAGPASLAAMTDAVARVVARAGAPAAVLGWSLGGLVAQRLALDRPDLVARLVLVCTTPRFLDAPDWPQAMAASTLARFGDELCTDTRATLLRFLTLQVRAADDGRRADRGVLATLRGALAARPPPTAASLANALAVLAGTDLRAEVARIGAPTLVLTGPRDALTPAAAGAWLAARIANARHVSIAGAAHAPFLSHPTAFLAALHAFLDAAHAHVHTTRHA